MATSGFMLSEALPMLAMSFLRLDLCIFLGEVLLAVVLMGLTKHRLIQLRGLSGFGKAGKREKCAEQPEDVAASSEDEGPSSTKSDSSVDTLDDEDDAAAWMDGKSEYELMLERMGREMSLEAAQLAGWLEEETMRSAEREGYVKPAATVGPETRSSAGSSEAAASTRKSAKAETLTAILRQSPTNSSKPRPGPIERRKQRLSAAAAPPRGGGAGSGRSRAD